MLRLVTYYSRKFPRRTRTSSTSFPQSSSGNPSLEWGNPRPRLDARLKIAGMTESGFGLGWGRQLALRNLFVCVALAARVAAADPESAVKFATVDIIVDAGADALAA